MGQPTFSCKAQDRSLDLSFSLQKFCLQFFWSFPSKILACKIVIPWLWVSPQLTVGRVQTRNIWELTMITRITHHSNISYYCWYGCGNSMATITVSRILMLCLTCSLLTRWCPARCCRNFIRHDVEVKDNKTTKLGYQNKYITTNDFHIKDI
jgi:hypothetical protein